METASSSIKTCSAITKLRESDMIKVQTLNRTASEATVKILEGLYRMPIVGIADIIKWTSYTPRGAYKAVERLVDMKILYPVKSGDNIYAQKWIYQDYIDLFNDS